MPVLRRHGGAVGDARGPDVAAEGFALTPADLAAALGVDPDAVKYGLFLGSFYYRDVESGVTWSVERADVARLPGLVRYERGDDVHQIPITTTITGPLS